MHATKTFLLVWVDDLVGSGDVFCGTLVKNGQDS